MSHFVDIPGIGTAKVDDDLEVEEGVLAKITPEYMLAVKKRERVQFACYAGKPDPSLRFRLSEPVARKKKRRKKRHWSDLFGSYDDGPKPKTKREPKRRKRHWSNAFGSYKD